MTQPMTPREKVANDGAPARRVRLEGAADIANYLGRPERWVYHAREKG